MLSIIFQSFKRTIVDFSARREARVMMVNVLTTLRGYEIAEV